MAYSTKDEVKAILVGLVETDTEYDVTPEKLSDAQIEREISNADSEIDLVLRKAGYNTPLSSPAPALIHQLSIDIALYLCDLIFRGSRAYENDNSPFKLRYDRANKTLGLIAEEGYPVFNPGDPSAPEQNADYEAVVINPYPDNVLLDKEVFPRGIRFFGNRAEYSEVEDIPYNYTTEH